MVKFPFPGSLTSTFLVLRRRPPAGNLKSHGARPDHQIISIIKWIHTSRLSISDLPASPDAREHAALSLPLSLTLSLPLSHTLSHPITHTLSHYSLSLSLLLSLSLNNLACRGGVRLPHASRHPLVANPSPSPPACGRRPHHQHPAGRIPLPTITGVP